MLKNRFYFMLGLMLFTSVHADNLYFSKIEQATISDKQLAETQQQLQDYQTVTIQKITLPPFHKRSEQTSKTDSFCTLCHLDLPHKDNVRLRSFLNMHTRYIACETCHFEVKNVKFDYRWWPELPKNNKLWQPHSTAKITPFSQEKPVIDSSTHPLFQQVKEQWKNLVLSEQAKLKAKIHQPLTETGCSKCHNDEKNILDLKQLGASESQQHAIEQNKIAHFLARTKDDTAIRLIDLLH